MKCSDRNTLSTTQADANDSSTAGAFSASGEV
jgi:hypothetical protein